MSDSFVSCLHDCEAILSMTYSATARHEQDAKRLRMHAYCILSGSLLFWKAPERVQIMKKVNRNNGAIDVTTVGGRIKKLRTDAGFTQEELAIELHLEGKSAISNYENNSRGVSAEMLTQLSRLFHVSADYILNGDSPDNFDPIVNEAIEILNNLKTDKAKKSALEMLRQIQILEG